MNPAVGSLQLKGPTTMTAPCKTGTAERRRQRASRIHGNGQLRANVKPQGEAQARPPTLEACLLELPGDDPSPRLAEGQRPTPGLFPPDAAPLPITAPEAIYVNDGTTVPCLPFQAWESL
jgi:hypothetical protein